MSPLSAAQLAINKALSPTTVTENGQLTYTFTVQNSGSTAADAAANVVITDTFDPRLSNLTVTLNGTALTAPTQYTYDAATGLFSRHWRVFHRPRHSHHHRHRYGVSCYYPAKKRDGVRRLFFRLVQRVVALEHVADRPVGVGRSGRFGRCALGHLQLLPFLSGNEQLPGL